MNWLKRLFRRERVLFMDLDGTLIETKSGETFPKDINDWKWNYLRYKRISCCCSRYQITRSKSVLSVLFQQTWEIMPLLSNLYLQLFSFAFHSHLNFNTVILVLQRIYFQHKRVVFKLQSVSPFLLAKRFIPHILLGPQLAFDFALLWAGTLDRYFDFILAHILTARSIRATSPMMAKKVIIFGVLYSTSVLTVSTG